MRDQMFPTAGYRDAHRRVGRIYALYGADERIALYEHDAPHQDIPAFRKEANEWLNLWLRNDRTQFDEGTIQRQSPDELRVLESYPKDAVNDHIDRMFIPVPATSQQHSLASWERRKSYLSAMLRDETFAAFPPAAP